MKPTRIRAWPESVGYIPLLSSVSDASNPTPELFLEFSGCTDVDSCGLTAILLKTLLFIEKINAGEKNVSWTTDVDLESSIAKRIVNLGFFSPIMHLSQPSLFLSDYSSKEDRTISASEDLTKKISYKIYHIQLSSSEDRRYPLKQFKMHLLDTLCSYESIYNINTRQLITIIYELAKNSADHTNSDAYFGLDIFEYNRNLKIQFLFGDTGEGIKHSIQSHFEDELLERAPYFSLTEAYHMACKKGFTSKPQTGKNLGVGMSTAIESSQMLGVTLSVFDAHSRGILSNLQKISHAEVRKIFYPVSRDTPFCYFGSIGAEKK